MTIGHSCSSIVSRMFLRILLVVLYSFVVYAENFYGRELLSTNTPYFWTRDARRLNKDQDTFIVVNQNMCEAAYVDVLLRHGARYPVLRWIQDMDGLESRLKQMGGSQTFPFLNSWTNPFPIVMNGQLSKLGAYEQITLGRRFASRFHSLLDADPELLEFYSSYKQRTKDSAIHFQRGMAENIHINTTEPIVDNIMLRFFDNCNLYSRKVLKNRTAAAEMYKFANGREISSVAASIKAKFSKGAFNISNHDVQIMRYICTYELTSFNESDWCQFFTEQDFMTYNYLKDLKNYWIKAYGHRLNYEISCPYFSHVFSKIDDAIMHATSNNYTRAVFRFGHAETNAPIFAALGLFHDHLPLTANDYLLETNRLFRSSRILPSSSNLAFVLYKCNPTDTYYLKLLVNEQDMIIPGCGQMLCPLSYVRRYLGTYINNCHFNSMCQNNVLDSGPFG